MSYTLYNKINNENLTLDIGSKATLAFDETIYFHSWNQDILVNCDGDNTDSYIPFSQCEIIID